MSKNYWFKIDRAKYKEPMIPILPQGYLAFFLFLLLICLAFVTSAYGYELFLNVKPWITIILGLLIGIAAFMFLIYCRQNRSKG